MSSLSVLLIILIIGIQVEGDIFGCCEGKTDGEKILFHTGTKDCNPAYSGDHAFYYYCCDGIPRYCVDADPGCYWINGDCLSEYNSMTCSFTPSYHNNEQLEHDKCNQSQYLMSFINHNSYWYCYNNQIYFNYDYPNQNDQYFIPSKKCNHTNILTSKIFSDPNLISTTTAIIDSIISTDISHIKYYTSNNTNEKDQGSNLEKPSLSTIEIVIIILLVMIIIIGILLLMKSVKLNKSRGIVTFTLNKRKKSVSQTESYINMESYQVVSK